MQTITEFRTSLTHFKQYLLYKIGFRFREKERKTKPGFI